jgi:hypothetical protein
MSIISLVSIHHYALSRDDSSNESTSANSLSRPWLAIRALMRMFRELSKKRLDSSTVVPHIQPYEIYVVYLSVVLYVEVGDRSDEGQWQYELQQMITYLQGLQKKWRIAVKCDQNLILCLY